jgi:transcription initiation factor IIF auxiliary subunit
LKLPLPDGYHLKSKEYQKIVNETVEQRKLLNEKSVTFLNYIQSQYTIDKFTTKLKTWYILDFGGFIQEINKTIKKGGGEKLTKLDEMDWMEVFETKKEEANKLKAEIDKTDKEIDQMVYELYELTEEEIEIVENS